MSDGVRHLSIVHVDTGRELRGGQRQLLILARGLRERGHRQLIVCPEGTELESRANAEGFSAFPLPAHDPLHAHGIAQLRQHLSLEPADILHAHDGKGQTLSWLASLGMPTRRVASRRVTFLPARRLDYRLKYGRTCHGVIAISEFIRDLVIQSGVPGENIEVIPDGIDIPRELPGPDVRKRARTQWGFEENDFVVGHLGTFTAEKGQELAVEAILQLQERIPEARLFLVGHGPFRTAAALVSKLKEARDAVRLENFVENPAEFFAALDLFIMPSRSEGLGSSVLLAMAYGLPVVATRVGGLPEVVEEGVTGWLVEPGSARHLAQGIAEAYSDGARRREFGARARERVQKFSSAIMVERTESFYQRLAAR